MKAPKLIALSAALLVALVLVLIWFLLRGEPSTPAEADAGGPARPDTTLGGGALAEADLNGDGIVFRSGMHPWIVQDEPGQCPVCGMDLMPVSVAGREAGSVSIDPVTLQNIGVRTATVQVEPLARTIRTTGRFVMDEQGERAVTLKVDGWIETLHANFEGARVREGEPLLELYSPELVSTQEEYLLALRNLQRLEGASAEPDAHRLLEAARRRMAYWDLSDAQIDRLKETGAPKRTLTFYAPSSGEVMRKQVVEGDYVRAGQPLMDIVDISKVWLIVDVYEQDLGGVGVGTAARIELPYQPGTLYEGRVEYLYPMLDAETRSARARIVLDIGHDGVVRPGMYATVDLAGNNTEPMPVVPEEAVIRTGLREVVVLALGDGRFSPIEVETGVESDGWVQVLEGLEGGEQIVTSAQFLIDSEARLAGAVRAMQSTMGDSTMEGSSDRAPVVNPHANH